MAYSMRIRRLHDWNVSYHQAVAIQERLRGSLREQPLPEKLSMVAGADISYSKRSPVLHAAVAVLALPGLEVVESCALTGKASFPYIPGLLSFREIPLVTKVFEKLSVRPDVVICDGQGIAHPRGVGLAAHLGLVLNLPAVGCAKTRLVGEHRAVGSRRWAAADLMFEGRVVGQVLRTRAGVKPLYVSPGHLVDLPGSVAVVRRCVSCYRLPEPIRHAHILCNEQRRMSE